MSLTTFIEKLEQPPNDYRPVVLWSWNGEITESRIDAMLQQFADQGMGGVFVEPRTGMLTEYLSDRYLTLWRHTVERCAELGLGCHIYDEYAYPSGTAGGRVIQENPKLEERVLELVTAEGEVERQVRGSSRRGPNKLVYPDLSRRETTNTFIQLTHERYRLATNPEDLGETVRYVFTDEPSLPHGKGAVHWSDELLVEFRDEHGYELADHVLELFFDSDESAAIRFDYYKTINRLYVENFFRPCYDWCETHGLQFTGHVHEHQWPAPAGLPDAMAVLRWMHVPGNDLLAYQFDPMRFSQSNPNPDRLWWRRAAMMNLRELASVSNQLGRERSFVETCGGGGGDYSIRDMKRLEDVVLAHGVNLIDPHLSHWSIAGARKTDWPHTYSDHSPWWPHYRKHADHITRVATALSEGREENRILVLQPTTSAWIRWFPNDGDVTAAIRNRQYSLCEALRAEQIDYDLGDEFILAELGYVTSDGSLAVGEAVYDAIVLPAGMENCCRSTLDLLRRLLENGGDVHAERHNLLTHLDGRPNPLAQEQMAKHGWKVYRSRDRMLDRLRRRYSPYLSAADGGSLPQDIFWRRVVTDSASIFFFCNPMDQRIRRDIRIAGSSALCVDTATGRTQQLTTSTEAGTQTLTLNLPSGGHLLLIVPDVDPEPEPKHSVEWSNVPLQPTSIKREEPNRCVLDYCALTIDGENLAPSNWHKVHKKLWDRQGITPPKYGTVPETELDTKEHQTSRPFSIRYDFEIAERLPLDGIELAIERPWLYTVRVNGIDLHQDCAEQWLDVDIWRKPVGPLLQPSINSIELCADRLHPLMELAPIYLLGAFTCTPSTHGFVLTPDRPLTLGDWTTQGHGFYPASVAYRYRFELERDGSAVRIALPNWLGSVAVLQLDDKEAGVLYGIDDVIELRDLTFGTHHLTVRIIGHLGSQMGPLHWSGVPVGGMFAGPDTQPPGQDYHRCPAGLLAPPVIETAV